MRTRNNTTCILLDRDTEDTALLQELRKAVVIILRKDNAMDIYKRFPMIMELIHQLTQEKTNTHMEDF